MPKKRGNASYNDPHIPNVKTNHAMTLSSVQLNAETLQQADCVVLTTNHDAFDIEVIQQHSKMIVDLRNMVNEASEKVNML